MAIDNIQLGGNIIREDSEQGITRIPENRTLMANQFTDDEPILPEVVEGLKTSEKCSTIFDRMLMSHFKTRKASL